MMWVELSVELATERRVKMKKWEEGSNEGINSERELTKDSEKEGEWYSNVSPQEVFVCSFMQCMRGFHDPLMTQPFSLFLLFG